uniref:Uncharacterized protein n=1 Tax=Leersia perrieri TaxID=77586 RepID=A0A0D9VBI0_9ORYZ
MASYMSVLSWTHPKFQRPPTSAVDRYPAPNTTSGDLPHRRPPQSPHPPRSKDDHYCNGLTVEEE